MDDENFNIYKYLQFSSIEGKLRKTDVAFERKVRRWYAKELGQSVSDTYRLSWVEIISHYYDNQIEEIPFNVIYNMAIDEYVPELAEEQEALDQAYADSLVEEQQETLRKKAEKKKREESSLDTPIKKAGNEIGSDKEDVELSFNMGNPDEDL